MSGFEDSGIHNQVERPLVVDLAWSSLDEPIG